MATNDISLSIDLYILSYLSPVPRCSFMFGSSAASPLPEFQNVSFGWFSSRPPSKCLSMNAVCLASVDGTHWNRQHGLELFRVSMAIGRYSLRPSSSAVR